MKKRKPKYNNTERRILRLLYQTKIKLNAYEISKQLKISIPTAKKYLKTLEEKGTIE